MPLTGKYLKYKLEITFEIFQKVWDKLISNGWTENNNHGPERRYREFSNGERLFDDSDDLNYKQFYINWKNDFEFLERYQEFKETTVEEILGYNPFNKLTEFPIEGSCKTDSKILRNYLKNKFPNIYKDWNNNHTIIAWNSGGYWYCIDKTGYKNYSLEELLPFINNKPNKQVVHCTTQEEWNFVLSKFNPRNVKSSTWTKNYCYLVTKHSEDNSYEGCTGDYNSIKNNYQILSFKEWCELNGYEMNKPKFEIGKWYKINNCWYAKLESFDNKSWNPSCCINIYGDFKNNPPKLSNNWEGTLIELMDNLEEIQQYLPEGHSDKIGFVLPEKWCVAFDSNNTETLANWIKSHSDYDSEYDAFKGYCLSDNKLDDSYMFWGSEKLPVFSYQEITFEQFKKYVLKESIQENTSNQAEKDWTKSSKEELLEEAKRRYPIGTKFKTLDCISKTEVKVIEECLCDLSNNIYCKTDEYYRHVYYKGNWAEIISLPEEKSCLDSPKDPEQIFRIGDWVYCEKQSSGDYRCDYHDSEQFIPVFQVKDFNKDYTFLRPEEGKASGVEAKYCRMATKEEVQEYKVKYWKNRQEIAVEIGNKIHEDFFFQDSSLKEISKKNVSLYDFNSNNPFKQESIFPTFEEPSINIKEETINNNYFRDFKDPYINK